MKECAQFLCKKQSLILMQNELAIAILKFVELQCDKSYITSAILLLNGASLYLAPKIPGCSEDFRKNFDQHTGAQSFSEI